MNVRYGETSDQVTRKGKIMLLLICIIVKVVNIKISFNIDLININLNEKQKIINKELYFNPNNCHIISI